MPTLPIAKTAEAGQETTGGQQHLSLPRLRVSIQPAAVAAVSAPQHGHGIWIPRRNSLADARLLVLRQAQDEWELPKDGRGSGQRRDSKNLPQDGADDLRGPESRDTEGRPAPSLPSPVAFAREVLGVQLWAKQEEVLTALTTHRRVAVKAGNGLGKGFCAAVAVLWFIHTHQDAAVALSTAPTFRQVRHILWRQIHRLYRPAAKTLGGTMLDTRWELADDRYALGLSADSAEQFQGFHNPNILIVVDEAEGVSEEIYEAIEAIITSADPLLLLIGNPTTMEGAFRRAFFEHRSIYRNITISALDSPNVQAGRVVIPGLTTSEWVDERKQIWQEGSPIYRSRVLGQFPHQGEDSLFSLKDLEAAVNRIVDAESWTIDSQTVYGPQRSSSEAPIIAVDVARFGPDSSVILRRRDDCVEDIQALHQHDTMQLAGRVAAAVRDHNPAHVFIDEIGMGAGVVDRLRELGHPVRGINVANRARQDEIFVNLRAEGYWALADRFRAGTISIPYDNQLISQLATLRYDFDSRGRIKIESKDDIRKRGLPSPDRADALMLAFLEQPGRVKLWT